MVRFRWVAAGVLVAGLLAGVAAAQGPRGGGPGRGMGGMLGLGPGLGELNLSDAQRDQFREVRSRYREETRGVVARLAEVRRKLREAVETVPVNEGLIMGVTQDLVQAEIDAALQEARLNAEVWSVLTPEQQARAVKLRAERQARMEERRERMEQRRGR